VSLQTAVGRAPRAALVGVLPERDRSASGAQHEKSADADRDRVVETAAASRRELHRTPRRPVHSMTAPAGTWSRVPIVLTRRRAGEALHDATHEPITLGLPFPPGAVTDAALLNLRDASDRRVPLQARALERWHDGSVKWALLDCQTRDDTTIFNVGAGSRMSDAKGIELTQTSGGVLVDTGAARFSMLVHRPFP